MTVTESTGVYSLGWVVKVVQLLVVTINYVSVANNLPTSPHPTSPSDGLTGCPLNEVEVVFKIVRIHGESH